MASKATLRLLLPLLALLAAPLAAQGAAARPLKIGVIDPERIVQESARGKVALEKLNKARDERVAAGNKLRQELSDLQKRINDGRLSLGADKLKQMQDEFDDKQVNLQHFGENAQRELTKLEQDVMAPVEDQILQVINQIGVEQGYTLIFKKFQSGLVFAEDSIDLTPMVVQRFDAAPPAARTAPAKPATKPPGH